MTFRTAQIIGAVICAFGLVLPKGAAMDPVWTMNPFDYWTTPRCPQCGGVRYAAGWEGQSPGGVSPNHLQYHFSWGPQPKPPMSEANAQSDGRPDAQPDTCPKSQQVSCAKDPQQVDWKLARSIYDFTVDDIRGNPVSLSKYKDYVLLIVNVASRCGLTAGNYRELVELHNMFHEKGLRILAFPCNQFGGQEPGTNEEIMCFARGKDAHFDFFDKIKVNGEDAHPLWKYLKKEQGGTFGDSIKWNFTKFIVDRRGKVVERHSPATDPLKLVSALNKYF